MDDSTLLRPLLDADGAPTDASTFAVLEQQVLATGDRADLGHGCHWKLAFLWRRVPGQDSTWITLDTGGPRKVEALPGEHVVLLDQNEVLALAGHPLLLPPLYTGAQLQMFRAQAEHLMELHNTGPAVLPFRSCLRFWM